MCNNGLGMIKFQSIEIDWNSLALFYFYSIITFLVMVSVSAVITKKYIPGVNTDFPFQEMVVILFSIRLLSKDLIRTPSKRYTFSVKSVLSCPEISLFPTLFWC